MNIQTRIQSCQAPSRITSGARIVAWTPPLIASAALFSLFFAGDGLLASLGVLGVVPLVLRSAGCPACGGTRQLPSAASWPGH